MSKELKALKSIEATLEMGLKDKIYVKELGVTADLDKEGFLNSVRIIRASLERNEPMKVINGRTINGVCLDYYCPSCKQEIDNSGYSKDQHYLIKYCISCGQRLDWSDGNE